MNKMTSLSPPQNTPLIMDKFEKIILALYDNDLMGMYDLTMPIYALMDQVLSPEQRCVLSQRVDAALRSRRLGLES